MEIFAIPYPMIQYRLYEKFGETFKDNVTIPNKKPRKSKSLPKPTLTRAQKRHNKKVGQKRFFVEHAIGGMKAFNILSTHFRNRKDKRLMKLLFLLLEFGI